MARICGAGIGFLGFSLSLIIGLAVGNSFATVVLRAVVVLFLGYILGCTLFWVGQKVILEHLESKLEKAQQSEQDDDSNNDSEIDPDLYEDAQGVEQLSNAQGQASGQSQTAERSQAARESQSSRVVQPQQQPQPSESQATAV